MREFFSGFAADVRRSVILCGIIAAAAGFVVAPRQTAVVCAAVAAVALAWAVRRLRHLRKWLLYVAPTEAAISDRLGGLGVRLRINGPIKSRSSDRDPTKAEVAVRGWYERRLQSPVRFVADRVMRTYWTARRPVDVAMSWTKPVGPARVRLKVHAKHLTKDQTDLVEQVIRDKIPLGDLNVTWDQRFWRVRAVWRARLRPPVRAGLADLEAVFPTLAEHQFYIGPTAGGGQLVIDLDRDSPHVGISGATGSGKTELAKDIAVQGLRRSGGVKILDRKGSHRWARNMPGITYCLDVADMHDQLIPLAALASRRNLEAFAQPDGWDPGPRELIILEELNATIGMLREYWLQVLRPRAVAQAKANGDDPNTVPTVSPAITAIKEILYMGRSAKVNIIALAQLLTTHAIGGTEARENLGIRALARYTRNAWKMLVGDAKMPRPSRTRGRWHFYIGGEVTEVQVVYLTTKQARAFAVTETPRDQNSGLTSDVTGDCDNRARMTLQDAIDEGILPGKYDAVRKRLSRARIAGQWTPPAYGRRGRWDLYSRDDLARWAAVEKQMLPEEAAR